MSMVSDWAARAVETRATELNLMIISTSQKRQWQQIRCVQLKSRSYLNYFFVNYFKTNQIESGPNLGNFVNSLQSNFTTIINYIIDNNYEVARTSTPLSLTQILVILLINYFSLPHRINAFLLHLHRSARLPSFRPDSKRTS